MIPDTIPLLALFGMGAATVAVLLLASVLIDLATKQPVDFDTLFRAIVLAIAAAALFAWAFVGG
ncbi:MAG: hypothetical protein OEZ19_03960 [Paracoccaceae bacterium]|nr:hypothetical protein [Paracoccaceae bacterium]